MLLDKIRPSRISERINRPNGVRFREMVARFKFQVWSLARSFKLGVSGFWFPHDLKR
jgi:hypothetical protein